jgi:hypothetical protein
MLGCVIVNILVSSDGFQGMFLHVIDSTLCYFTLMLLFGEKKHFNKYYVCNKMECITNFE